MNICILGTGYVGLVTGTCFAELGNTVWCVDVDEIKINRLKLGVVPIYEPGLAAMVDKNVKAGRLHFTTELKQGLEQALVCFITVGTPPREDGSADLSDIVAAARAIGSFINNYLIVVNKSTVPVGTADKVREVIKQQLTARGKNDVEFDIVANPEFLKEGAAVEDCMQPDRVVIGADNMRAAELIKQLYEPIVPNDKQILIMDIKSAEITKYAANAMLATRISFINEIAQLCGKVGADIASVRKGIGTDRRIGPEFLHAGVGYGGSCFPKDVKELISTGRKYGLMMEIAAAVDSVNERQKYYLVELIKNRFGENLGGKRFGIWGLAFKPQTDDMREAPSLVIVQALVKLGATITAFDPAAMEQARKIFVADTSCIQFADNMMQAAAGADALVLITEWPQFRQPDFAELKRCMRQPLIFDGRNQYEPSELAQHGFEYYCVGRSYHAW